MGNSINIIVNCVLYGFAGIAFMMFLQYMDLVTIMRARSKKQLSGDKQELVNTIRLMGFPNFDLSRYAAARNILFLLLVAFLATIGISSGGFPYIPAIIVAMLYLLSAPTKISILSLMSRAYKSSQQQKKNEEVFRIILRLKNMAAVGITDNSTQILMSLAGDCNALKRDFAKLLREWVNNNRVESVDNFVESIGTQDAAMLGSIIKKLDMVPLEQLYEQLRLYQDVIFEEKQTIREKRDARNGDMFFAFVTGIFFIIMLDFVIVMVFGMMGDFMNGMGI